MKEPKRCSWATSEVSIPYHDAEWGVPVHDERHLFEMLTLEGVQAGLSWDTILRKRDGYRQAFANFEPERVAKFVARDVTRLMNDAGIVRNRLKIESTISNAKALLELRKETSLSDFLWSFVDHKPLRAKRAAGVRLPAQTTESDAMSRELKKRGFRFVGSTICYAFMQATGMVNDHEPECFRAAPISKMDVPRVGAHGNVPATRPGRNPRPKRRAVRHP